MAQPRAITISKKAMDIIMAEAGKADGLECCGLLLGHRDGHVDAAVPCANIAADPATRFELDPAALLAAHRAARAGGPKLLGHYHSHPNGRAGPSPCDAEMAGETGMIWAIVANGSPGFWMCEVNGPLHGRFAPLAVRIAETD